MNYVIINLVILLKIIIESILYIVIILFPILLNLFFITYKKNINKKTNNAFLNISLLSSMYLSIYFSQYLDSSTFIIFSTVVIFISLFYKQHCISLLLSLIFYGSLNSFNFNKLSFLILITLYIVIYMFYLYRKLSKKLFLIFFEIITIICFLLFFKNLNYFILILYFINGYISIFLLLKANEILNIFSTLKEVKKENIIKISLFKITHEIKNPLAVIKGYLDMFNINNKEKGKKYINIIKNEINRTLNLLSDLNEYNKIKINKTEFNFSIVLDELKELVVAYSKENKINCIFKTEKNILINADAERIKQVLINMIKNSIEASKINSTIYFISYTSKGKLFIFIEDNGNGMDKETLENLFTPFYTTKDSGTGLGLCLSKEIIESHKGSITYSSILNKGTIAKIVIPLN